MIKFCEFCGAIGAKKAWVEGVDYSGYFYLCEKCSDEDGEDGASDYTLKGVNREDLLSNARESTLVYHGPKNCPISGEESNLISCDHCHRKVSPLETWGFSREAEETTYNLPPIMIQALPKNLRGFKSIWLCPLCQKEVFLKIVNSIKESDLPLHITFNEFKFEDKVASEFNNEIIGYINQRLKGETIKEELSLKEPSEHKFLDVSLSYLTEKDLKLLRKEVEIKENEKGVTRTGFQPFIVIPYDNGFFLELKNPFFKVLLSDVGEFGYSSVFKNIIAEALNMKYAFIRFDSVAPLYEEFNQKERK